MSETNETQTDFAGLLPGYTLHRLNNSAIGAVEDALQRFYVERTIFDTVHLAASLRTPVISQAIADAAFQLCGGGPSFRRAIDSADGRLITIIASVGVGLNGGKVNEADVAAKVNELDPAAVQAAVDWCWRRPPAARRAGENPQ